LVLPVGLIVLSGDAPRSPDPLRVRSWLTTPDGRQLLAEQDPVSFGGTPISALTIAVDPTREYQVVDGFGASITDSSAAVLHRLDPETRDATLVQLFDPRRGAGLSYLRQPMGASDFVDEEPYTYDDMAPGGSDYDMEHFNIEHDERQILPLLRRARALNPQLRVMASPWTAPAWMKTNGSLVGGSLTDDPRIYRAYARYFVEFLQAYAAAGVQVDAITVQNEPQQSPSDYPGMLMSPRQQATFISVLGPALRAAGLRTAILAHDDTWASSAPAPVPGSTPVDSDAEGVLGDPAAARWVDGVAFHCYSGRAGVQADVQRRVPDAQIVLSECSGYRRSEETPSVTFARSLGTFARLAINTTRNWARAVLTWNLALGPEGGPHRGGCGTCTGLVTVGPGQGVTYNAEYYALASLSRLVRPGAVRIASTSFPLIGDKGGLITAAFRNPHDASITLVAHNLTGLPRRFAVRLGDRGFTTSLAGGAVATFSWPGAATPTGGLVLLDPSGIRPTASPGAPVDPCCTGDVPVNAVDENAGTRWSTGHSQRPGDHLQLDLGDRRQVARVVLDAGTATADAPQQWALYAGDDPGTFGRPVAEGRRNGQLTSIDLTGVTARYVRIATTGQASTWWSIAEVRVYVRR
jgi:glucosylceramidase